MNTRNTPELPNNRARGPEDHRETAPPDARSATTEGVEYGMQERGELDDSGLIVENGLA